MSKVVRRMLHGNWMGAEKAEEKGRREIKKIVLCLERQRVRK